MSSTDALDIQSSAKSSTSTVLSALILNGSIFGAEMVLFLILRPQFKKIYASKTFLGPSDERTPSLSKGILSWIPEFFKISDTEILKRQGLDAYVLMELLAMFIHILVPITLLTWVVLLPLYAAKSGGVQTGLNQLTFGNVGTSASQQLRYIGSLLIQYLATGWICYNIRTRMTKFIKLRQDFLISEKHSETSQAKTILVTGIPNDYLSDKKLRLLYDKMPGGVKEIWLNRDLGELPDLVEERFKLCNKLEGAEAKMIKNAYKKYRKSEKKNKGNGQSMEMINERDQERDLSSAAVSSFVDAKDRPTHKLGFLGLLGEKVDTIEYCGQRIAELNEMIENKRNEVQNDYKNYPPQNSAFILFNTQIAAHMAVKAVAHHLPYRMADNYIEAHPLDVVWSNVSMNPYEKKLRNAIGWAITIGIVVFWSIPVAFVGVISNIQGLATEVSFLGWLNSIPTAVTGIIQSILPSALLSVLNMLLPIVLRLLARLSGMPTATSIELSLQTRFWLFQIIQNFLFLTIISGVSGGVTAFVLSISNDPGQIPGLLAQYIPVASTFFISFLLLQGLAGSASGFLQVVPLIMYYLKKFLLGTTARKLWHIENDMSSPKMGTLFPTILLIAVIAVGYMIIAPILNGFALVTFILYYYLYKYLFLYVYDMKPQNETSGLFFPKAMNHLLAALYVEMVMLTALFFAAQDDQGNQSAIPEGAFMIILIVLVAGFHFTLIDSFSALHTALPLSLVTNPTPISEKPSDSIEIQRQVEVERVGTTNSEIESPTEEKKSLINQPQVQSLNRDQEVDNTNSNSVPRTNGLHSRDSDLEILHTSSFIPPALKDRQRTIWIGDDRFGIGKAEVLKLRAKGLDATTEFTSFNSKDKVEVNAYTPPGEIML